VREAARSEFIGCDRSGCVYREEGRPVVAFPSSLAAVVEDCEKADIVAAAVPVPRRVRNECSARLLLDYFFFWRNGATTITLASDSTFRIHTARELRGERPWVQRSRDRQ